MKSGGSADFLAEGGLFCVLGVPGVVGFFAGRSLASAVLCGVGEPFPARPPWLHVWL